MSEPVEEEGHTATARSLRNHVRLGLAVLLLLVGGFGGWAATTRISGAVIAAGRLVVDSNVKKVQHPTGGIVNAIEVRNGDVVKAGHRLMRLDPTVTRANLSIVASALDQLQARTARLRARGAPRTCEGAGRREFARGRGEPLRREAAGAGDPAFPAGGADQSAP
jgi:HlyD family secretion protein